MMKINDGSDDDGDDDEWFPLWSRLAATGKRLRHLGINLGHEFCTIIYDDHGDDDVGDDDRDDDYDDNEDNNDDNHDNDSYNHVCADEIMLIN